MKLLIILLAVGWSVLYAYSGMAPQWWGLGLLFLLSVLINEVTYGQ